MCTDIKYDFNGAFQLLAQPLNIDPWIYSVLFIQVFRLFRQVKQAPQLSFKAFSDFFDRRSAPHEVGLIYRNDKQIQKMFHASRKTKKAANGGLFKIRTFGAGEGI